MSWEMADLCLALAASYLQNLNTYWQNAVGEIYLNIEKFSLQHKTRDKV